MHRVRRRGTASGALALLVLLAASLGMNSGCGLLSQREGEVAVLIGVDANKLDPQFYSSTVELSLIQNIFDALLFRNDKMGLDPALARSWKVSPDGRTWTFFLRRGVRFHNGEPFNARAVKFTFERMMDEEVGATTTIARRIELERVEVVDEFTVRLHTRRPVATTLTYLANAFILEPKHYTSFTPRRTSRRPVGTGPYRLKEWIKDDHLILEAFKDYWRGEPKLKKVLVRPVPEGSSRVAELETGGADIIVNVPLDLAPDVQKAEGARLMAVQGGRRIFIGIRSDVEPFGDRRVRQALNYAVNFEAISRHLLLGLGSRMATIVNPPHENKNLKPYRYDPQKAKRLFHEAGLRDSDGDGYFDEDGKRYEFLLDTPSGRYLRDKDIAVAVASDLRKVGLYVRANPLDWSVYTAKRHRRGEVSPLYLLGFSSAFSGITDLAVLDRNLQANLTRWENAEFQKGFEELQRILDPERQRDLLDHLQEIVMEEAPWIFLWKQYDLYGVSRRIDWRPRADERIYLWGVNYLKER
ncbi:MAG: ABC transporter substrate-binding protein [Nitrospinota bacterium]